MTEELDKKKPPQNEYLRHTLSLTVLAIVLGLIVYFSNARPSAKTLYGLFADAFSLSGLLGLMGGLFTIAVNAGTFDLLSYGVKRVFRGSFDKNYKKNMPQTFLEYQAAMKAKRKKPGLALFIISGAFLVVGIVFIVLFTYLPNIAI